ncbi:MAG: DinB family protein [Salinivenus sp.]
MHPQFESYRSGFHALKEEATALVDGRREDELMKAPDADTWAVVQLFDHVNTAGWLLLHSIEDAIQTAKQEGPYGEPPFEYGFVSRWFVRSMQPSSGWTFTAPSVFEPDPPHTLHANEVVEEFRGLQDQFADCVSSAEGLDLRRLRAASPALPFLRISVGAWFEATLAHEERHLTQAREVLNTLPAAS